MINKKINLILRYAFLKSRNHFLLMFLLLFPFVFSSNSLYSGFCYNPDSYENVCPDNFFEVYDIHEINESELENPNEIRIFLANSDQNICNFSLDSVKSETIIISSLNLTKINLVFNNKLKSVVLENISITMDQASVELSALSLLNTQFVNILNLINTSKFYFDLNSVENITEVETIYFEVDASKQVEHNFISHNLTIKMKMNDTAKDESYYKVIGFHGSFSSTSFLNVGYDEDTFDFDKIKVTINKENVKKLINYVIIDQVENFFNIGVKDSLAFKNNDNVPHFYITLDSNMGFFSLPTLTTTDEIGMQFSITIKSNTEIFLNNLPVSLTIDNSDKICINNTNILKTRLHLVSTETNFVEFNCYGNYEIIIDVEDSSMTNYNVNIKSTKLLVYNASSIFLSSNTILFSFISLNINALDLDTNDMGENLPKMVFGGNGIYGLNNILNLTGTIANFSTLMLNELSKISINFLLSQVPLILTNNPIINNMFIPLEIKFFYIGTEIPNDDIVEPFLNKARTVLIFPDFPSSDLYVHLDPFCTIDGFSESLSLINFNYDQSSGELSFCMTDFPSIINSIIGFGAQCEKLHDFNPSAYCLNETEIYHWNQRFKSFTKSLDIYLFEELPSDAIFNISRESDWGNFPLDLNVFGLSSGNTIRFPFTFSAQSQISNVNFYNILIDIPTDLCCNMTHFCTFKYLIVQGGSKFTDNALNLLNFDQITYLAVELSSFEFLTKKEINLNDIILLVASDYNQSNIVFMNQTTINIDGYFIHRDDRFIYYFLPNNITVKQAFTDDFTFSQTQYKSNKQPRYPLEFNNASIHNEKIKNDKLKNNLKHIQRTFNQNTSGKILDDSIGYFNIYSCFFDLKDRGNIVFLGEWNISSFVPAITLLDSTILNIDVLSESEIIPISFEVLSNCNIRIGESSNNNISHFYITCPMYLLSSITTFELLDPNTYAYILYVQCNTGYTSFVEFSNENFVISTIQADVNSKCSFIRGDLLDSLNIYPGSSVFIENMKIYSDSKFKMLFDSARVPLLSINSKDNSLPSKIEINGTHCNTGHYKLISSNSIHCSSIEELISLDFDHVISETNSTVPISFNCNFDDELIFVVGGDDEDDDNDNKEQKNKKLMIILIISISGLLAILIIVFAVIIYKKRKKSTFLPDDISNPLTSQITEWEKF